MPDSTGPVTLSTGVAVTDDRPVQPRAEWLTECRQRFGDDPYLWAFECPNCGDVATGAEFRDALADSEVATSAVLGQHCIGRHLGALQVEAGRWDGRGCDWVAFGLLGTLGKGRLIDIDGRVVEAFNFAPDTNDPSGTSDG